MIPLVQTVGRIELGAGFAILLSGITILQAHLYFQTTHKQLLSHRLFVLWVWLLDIIHSALCVETVYRLVVTNYMAPSELDLVKWNQMTLLILGIISAVTAHIYFTRRFWLTKKRCLNLAILSTSISVLQFVFAIFGTFPVFYRRTGSRWSTLSSQKSTMAVTVLTIAFGLLADVLLVGIFGEYAWKIRRTTVDVPAQVRRDSAVLTQRYGSQRGPSAASHVKELVSEPKVRRFAIWALASNAILSVVVIASYAIMPRDALFLGVMMVQSKIYTGALIAYMHSRKAKPTEQMESSPPSMPLQFQHSAAIRTYTDTLEFGIDADRRASTSDNLSTPLDALGEAANNVAVDGHRKDI